MPRSVTERERENLRRQRLRVERDAIQHRGERELALVSADDDDAAGNAVKFIGSQSLVLGGSEIGHGRSLWVRRDTLSARKWVCAFLAGLFVTQVTQGWRLPGIAESSESFIRSNSSMGFCDGTHDRRSRP